MKSPRSQNFRLRASAVEQMALEQRRRFFSPAIPEDLGCELVTIVDASFLPSLAGLLTNWKRWSTNTLHALDLFGDAKNNFPSDTQLRFYSITDLEVHSKFHWRKYFRKNWVYTLKPHFIKEVFSTVQRPVLYADVDIHFRKSPKNWLETGREEAVTLLPHFHRDPQRENQHGLYNAGLVYFGKSGADALDWWAHQSFRACEENPRKGLYYDQKYLDSLSVRFQRVRVDRTGRHNIGPWTDRKFVTDVDSLHASAPHPDGKHLEKYLWDEICSLSLGIRPKLSHCLEIRRHSNLRLDRLLRLQHFLRRWRLSLPEELIHMLSTIPGFEWALEKFDEVWSKQKIAVRP